MIPGLVLAGGGLETFDGFDHSGGSYESGSFAGQDGSTWTYAKARGDFSINGASPTLEKAKGAYIRSGTIPGGVGTLSLKYQKHFSPSLSFEVYVNDMLIGTIAGGDGTVQTWTSDPVNIEGDVVLLFSNRVNSGTITLDDISWTGHIEGMTPPAFDSVAMQAVVVGQAVAFTISALGEPLPELALIESTATIGYEFDPQTGGFTYLPSTADTGPQTFTFTASNPVGVATLDVSVMVREADGVFGLETFDGFGHAGSDFASGTFTGQDGAIWTYALASGDQSIDGASPTLDKARGAFIRSGMLPGGIGSLELQYRRAGNQAVDCAVYVNGVQVGSITGGDGSIQTWSRTGLNVAGDVVLLFSNKASSGRITLDNIAWTGHSTRPQADVFLSGLAQTYTGEPRVVSVSTAPEGLPVVITYDGSVVPPTDAGTYAVIATVIDGVHDGVAHGTLVVAKADQSIAFPEIGDRIDTDQLDLSAIASSGLPVDFTVVSGPASLVNGTLTFQGTGEVSIAASQPGDANWNPAPAEVQSFNVLSLLAVSTSHLYVRENGEGRFFVQLNREPVAPTTVTVARVSGDPDLVVKSGAVTVIHPWNWTWWQPVTLTALDDEDAINGQAVFEVAIPGVATQLVTATELDDDIGRNLALASRGATITGGRNPERLIDGLHMSSANYGHMLWGQNPPEAMVLKLRGPAMVSRIRVLNWDWLYPVTHRYTIESSMDGTNWTLLVDATADERKGWDEWAVDDQEMRYLRLTGVSNSANGLVCIAEWEVHGEWVVQPAAVVLQNLYQTYDGTPREVVVETDPPALPVQVVYEPAAAGRRGVQETIELGDGEVPVAAGTYLVQAEVTEDGFVGQAYDILVVEKADQTIVFPPPGTQSSLEPLSLTATASSGLPVQYTVLKGPAVLDESGTRLVFTSAGTVIVAASQYGDNNWNPAADVSVTFQVESPEPYLILSKSDVNVREGGEGRFYIRLSRPPTFNVRVNVTPVGETPGLIIQNGAVRTFTTANWNAWQAVTLAASADENAGGGSGAFRISAPGFGDQFVTVNVLAGDIGENLALASGGATVSGWRAGRMAQLIDGIHDDNSNYAYTIWTNEPPGTFTLDLQSTVMVSRVRLLNWDWNYRTQRYVLESSADGMEWSLMADASQDDRHGWDDWEIDGEVARYLRFVGVTNTANPYVLVAELEVYGERILPPQLELSKTVVNVREAGEGRFFVRLPNMPPGPVRVQIERVDGSPGIGVRHGATRSFTSLNWDTWQAVTLAADPDANGESETATFRVSAPGFDDLYVEAVSLDGDVGDNLALASNGASIAGSKASRLEQLNDGEHSSNINYGFTIWDTEPKGAWVLDLGDSVDLSRVRLLNWDWIYRTQRYVVESSVDGEQWSMLIDASQEDRHGWDEWRLDGPTARYLRFTGLTNSANGYVLIAELEVYGTPAVPEPAPAAMPAGISGPGAFQGEDSVPVVVLTSNGPEDDTGWNVLDGDPETAWVGQVGGGYLVIGYEPELELSVVEVDLAEDSLTTVDFLYSLDAEEWLPLPDDMEAHPVLLRYLWLVFPDDGSDAAPVVGEVRINP